MLEMKAQLFDFRIDDWQQPAIDVEMMSQENSFPKC